MADIKGSLCRMVLVMDGSDDHTRGSETHLAVSGLDGLDEDLLGGCAFHHGSGVQRGLCGKQTISNLLVTSSSAHGAYEQERYYQTRTSQSKSGEVRQR